MNRILLSAAASLMSAICLAAGAGAQDSYPDANAIVSIGGPVTETIFALGQGERVVARDTTSTYPAQVHDLPDVGYMRRLSAEGVLSVSPDLIITRDTAGPMEALDQLRAAVIPMVEIHDGFNPTNVIENVRIVGTALGLEAEGNALAEEIAAQFDALLDETLGGEKPRAMFVLSNQGGRLNVAGRATGANGIMTLAGVENVMSEAYEGYKIMSDEAILEAAPEVIVMMDRTGQDEHDAKRDEVLGLPAIALTPAGRTGAFVLIDPAALGFGPRTAELARSVRAAVLDAVAE